VTCDDNSHLSSIALTFLVYIAVRRYRKYDSRRWKHAVSDEERSEANDKAWKAMYIQSCIIE